MPTDPTQPNLVVVDVYENGYDQPPTKRGVQTLPVDPSNLPTVGGKVAVATVKDQPYSLNSGSGTSTFDALITNVASGPTVFQVDIYGSGFPPASPTLTAQVAKPIDATQANFQVGDPVAVFKDGAGIWRIASSKPWATTATRARLAARITGLSGSTYSWVETVKPGGSDKPGGLTGSAAEATGSLLIDTGAFVYVELYDDGNYYIDRPFGTNA